jgi:hypothetical protein
VQVNFAAGKAQLHVQNLPVEEYFTLPNALADGPEIDATISFDAVWSGPVTRRLNFQNGAAIDPFAGEFVENQVTVSWSGSNANGFSFTSNPGNFSTSVDSFSELGHDRNGRFFNSHRASAGVDLAVAFAPLSLPGGNSAVSDLGNTGIGHSLNSVGNGLAQAIVPSDLKNSWTTNTGKLSTVVSAARESAFEFVWDPIATSLVTKT